jgi:multimeric flavodoxin WrbA
MTEHGWPTDAWPDLYKKVQAAEMLVIGTPIWLGDKSSVCTQVIERMYGNSAELNDRGQYAYYGKWADASSPATKTAPNIAP